MYGHNPWDSLFPIMYPPPPYYNMHNMPPPWYRFWTEPPQAPGHARRGGGRRGYSSGGRQGRRRDPLTSLRDMEDVLRDAERQKQELESFIERNTKKKDEKKPDSKLKQVFQTAGAIFILGPPIIGAYLTIMGLLIWIGYKLLG